MPAREASCGGRPCILPSSRRPAGGARCCHNGLSAGLYSSSCSLTNKDASAGQPCQKDITPDSPCPV